MIVKTFSNINYNKTFLVNSKVINIQNFFLTYQNVNKLYIFKNFIMDYKNYKIFFINNVFLLKYVNIKNKKLRKTLLFLFCGFTYAKIFLKVGLGFRKKFSKKFNLYNLSVGRRKWVVFSPMPTSFFFNVRRRNIFLFCNSKKKLYWYITHLRYMRKETVFKVKGIMTLNRIKFNRRISRSIIFARRVKFRKMKLKLTKKQKQRR